jgi:hypothetical protein
MDKRVNVCMNERKKPHTTKQCNASVLREETYLKTWDRK